MRCVQETACNICPANLIAACILDLISSMEMIATSPRHFCLGASQLRDTIRCISADMSPAEVEHAHENECVSVLSDNATFRNRNPGRQSETLFTGRSRARCRPAAQPTRAARSSSGCSASCAPLPPWRSALQFTPPILLTLDRLDRQSLMLARP